ncbi:4'-phosphopantetheinyl transferase superfamily protein [Dactylosporangium sp. NBC_01737]|uniref:4'-phosphopantetheinyl transferase family protein n=1 Tax=Dactylosporangium sp. NBC_01737 TaxID=2975959 RepID=UPI002E159E87|nr:4'-phosphopantetheinyl transferase superfamily protein [Dactylosporangium sp. NBC_01737]
MALSRAGDVGVDLEPAGRRPSALAWSCSPAERAWLAGRPPGERPAAFTRLWTRKEACVKARGTGIRHRLADVHCGPRPAGRWRDVWWRDVWVADGFCAAVAITTGRDGFDVRLRHTTLPGRIR